MVLVVLHLVVLGTVLAALGMVLVVLGMVLVVLVVVLVVLVVLFCRNTGHAFAETQAGSLCFCKIVLCVSAK
jgi:hypothetical protein